MRPAEKMKILKIILLIIVVIVIYVSVIYKYYTTPLNNLYDDKDKNFNSLKESIVVEEYANVIRKTTQKRTTKGINIKANVPVEVCTNEERLNLIQSLCDPALGYDDMNRKERVTFLFNTFVDTKHKILACLPPKSGCTTWKNILANNSQEDPLPEDFKMMNLHYGALKDYEIKTLGSYNESTKAYMLKNYYKIMITRHPLERFRSAYIDKLESGKDLHMRKQIGEPILQMFRPHLPESQLSKGIGVTIGEMIDYMQHTPNFRNPHWAPCYNICQPCRINYDRILKTETLDHDSEYVILNLLKPTSRGLGIKGNVVAGGHKDASLTLEGRLLDKYINATPAQLSFLEKYYENDFKMFGYSWKYLLFNGTYNLRSSCVSGGKHHTCC